MSIVDYFIPDGQHDGGEILGLGWGPRTVLIDGTVLNYDARDEIIKYNFKEIEQRLKKFENDDKIS